MRLELEDLEIAFQDRGTVIGPTNQTIQPGDFVLIEGPSGSGKTTVLRALCLLQEPTRGRVLFDGKEVAPHDVPRIRTRVVYLQQSPVMLDGTVRDNLLLPYQFRVNSPLPVPPNAELEAGLQRLLLKNLKLDDPAGPLSVGQKQRAALLRVLLLKPDVVLCDEPTSALDPESRRVVEKELECLHQDGVTVVMVTHSGYSPSVGDARRWQTQQGQPVKEMGR